MQRLEAEEIRDSLLAVSGWLDPRLGGKTLPLRNKEFVFNHTSKDHTTYESPRRALYVPIIRNHLYDMLEQFDYPDPTMCTGSRNSTVVAPQALIMMNSPVAMNAADKLSDKLLAASGLSEVQRIDLAYMTVYARHPWEEESSRAENYLTSLRQSLGISGREDVQRKTWSLFCQTLMAANEFIYVR